MTIGGGQGGPLGIALALGAALVYAVYIVVGSRLLRDVDPLAASSVICAAATASCCLIAAGRTAAGDGPHWPATMAAWMPVAALAVLSTALAIGAFFAGLRLLGATAVVIGTAIWLALQPAAGR
jgi:drug/metabolite transporter (DMT)-like permease